MSRRLFSLLSVISPALSPPFPVTLRWLGAAGGGGGGGVGGVRSQISQCSYPPSLSRSWL